MASYGKHTRNPGYQPGNHWVVCQVCGFHLRSKEARRRWDGLIVCPEDWEARHPQDFVRAVEDYTAAEGLVSPPSEDEFVYPTCTTRTAIAGIAIAGCSFTGYNDETTIPTGTFGGSL